MSEKLTAAEIIRRLSLSEHPEGGWYRETWRAKAKPGDRATGTAIYFLLEADKPSRWHRVDAAEIWHFYAGAPLCLQISKVDEGPFGTVILGADLMAGHIPQAIVPMGHWQAAETTGDWTLVGCTVSPGFEFEGFELAPAEFEISKI